MNKFLNFSFRSYLKSNKTYFILICIILFFSQSKIFAEDYSLNFNGTNEYVSVPFNSTMNPSGDFSVSAWVKLSAVTSRSETVNGNQTGGYMLYISNANKWQFWNGDGATDGTWAQANGSRRIVQNTWQMQTVTYDQANTHMKLYVDGVLVAQNNSAYYFNGKIDDR